MNSLGVDPFVNHLYHDLSNGYILFQVSMANILSFSQNLGNLIPWHENV